MILPWSHSLSQKWDAYCDQHDQAWFWHRSGWMKYCDARHTPTLNLSFAMISGEKIVGICPIILEDCSLTYQAGPCPRPICEDRSVQIEMMSHLKAIFDSYLVEDYTFRGNGNIINLPSKNISWKTRIIDVQPLSEIELVRRWRNVRKSYKSLINNTHRSYRIEKSINPRDVHILHALHREQAGCETRPQASWDLMAAWVHTGHAYLCLCWNSAGICEGAIYVYSYKGHEYYGHAATNKDNINHALIWEALRTSDAHTFEMGWQGHAETIKEQHIEFFRRGFGGIDHPLTVSRITA